MKRYIVLIIVLISSIGFSQNEANTWYFGNNAGLSFNSGNPVALNDGQMATEEGCASISDSNGNLQFYTDGSTIWTKNHSVMVNGTGLNGNFSSTQSAIIIPKPDTPNFYYVFTVDFQGQSNGLQYSEVDMTLNGGLGAVTTTKNVLLLTPVLEKLTAVKHANGKDIWVICHRNGSAEFYSYLVTISGVQTPPIVTDIGFNYSGPGFDDNAGYMKVSPDGRKIAMAFPKFTNGVQLFDFNNGTGELSNHLNLFYDVTSVGRPYGLEFSPSGDILYVSGSGAVSQFDITLPSAFEILFNATFLSNEITDNSWGALQLAPDGKIYITRKEINGAPEISTLSVINNPDVLGPGCDFQLDTISLVTGIAQSGLPPFIQSFFIVGFEFENVCFGDSTQFNANISQTYDSLIWDFGDGSTSAIENPSHTYLSTGDYNVVLTVTSGGQTSTENETVTIYEKPTATQPQDMLVCDDDNDGFYTFNLTTQNPDILNGQSSTDFSVTYYASITDYTNGNPIIAPNNYTNASAYTSQTIVASVTNISNASCEATTIFNIQVFDTPTPSINIPKLSFCDNTSAGTDDDGSIIFDLTQNEITILNGQLPSDFTVNYYRDSGLTSLINIPSAYQNLNQLETIYVEVINNNNTNCKAQTTFEIEVFELPTVSQIVSLKQCDDDLDGFSIFNLTEVNAELSGNHQNETITFYETQAEANIGNNPITNETNYTNQTVSTDNIWTRVENTNNCYRIVQVNLIVSTTQIQNNYIRNFYECDDDIDITDGITTFDFSLVNNEIEAFFPMGQQLIIKYYRNQSDALSEINPISDITNYQNIGYPNSQDIFIRVDSALDNDCLGLGHHITLHVEQQPIANPVTIGEQCDDDGDGMYAFNTSQVETTLLNGQTNVSVFYNDENGDALPSPLPNPFLTASQTITATVTNSTSQDSDGPCFDETPIVFNVDAAAVANPVNAIIECDDDNDRVYSFDTSLIEASVLNGQTGMLVSYTDENGNSLPSPLPNPFITSTQTITIKVENPLSNVCFDTTTLDFLVIDKPELLMNDTWLICENDTVEILADTGFDEYLWSTGETSESIVVDTTGSYEVTVTNTYNSVRCSTKKIINVISSGIAEIRDIQTRDWSRTDNKISVFVEGTGDYEYSIDGFQYQDSNEFKNLNVSDYIVYVRDKNGCGVASKDIYLMYYPHFFTPNGDGYHDTWQLYNSEKEPSNRILIYDRYGKLLKELSPLETGWDGTVNGELLISNDYWFVLERQNGQTYRGHFTLKI